MLVPAGNGPFVPEQGTASSLPCAHVWGGCVPACGVAREGRESVDQVTLPTSCLSLYVCMLDKIHWFRLTPPWHWTPPARPGAGRAQ